MTSTTSKKPSTKKALASGKGGLRGLEDLNPTTAIIKETASVIPFIIKTVFVLGVGYFLYGRYTNRFIKLKENNNYPNSNITNSQGKTRADAIVSSIGWISNSFDTVSSNIQGLNYNGFIRLYNNFGHQRGTIFAGELNLIEWIKNQFSEDEVQQLSFLTNGVFF